MSEPQNTLPLTSDTGANFPSWCIDWLAMTIWGLEPERVARLVSEAFHFEKPVGLSGWEQMGGARFYSQRYEYLGASLLTGCYSKGADDNVHVVMPGEACRVGVDILLRLLWRLQCRALRFEVTRLDLAVDGVPFTPHDAYAAVRAGHTVSWVRRGPDGTVSHSWVATNGKGEGSTLYIGRPSSLRRLRIYDKRGPTRIELQTKAEYARALASELQARDGNDQELARFVVGCLREFCDFGIQDGHGVRGVQLLPWWEEFIGSADRIGKIVIDPRLEVSVDKTLAWLDRAVMPSLAMAIECYKDVGRRFLDDGIEYATPRLSAKHRAKVREFQHAYGHLVSQPVADEDAA